MPDLLIRIKKNIDGSASLTCIRADGSATWQRQDGQRGAVFPPHDMTHYVIESTLGYRNGFYGLIADGWEFSDFGTPFPRGPLPREAREVEALVGAFDLERRTGDRGSSAELNEQVRFALSKGASSFPTRQLTDEEPSRVRQALADVFARWWAVEPGSALELPFERS